MKAIEMSLKRNYIYVVVQIQYVVDVGWSLNRMLGKIMLIKKIYKLYPIKGIQTQSISK